GGRAWLPGLSRRSQPVTHRRDFDSVSVPGTQDCRGHLRGSPAAGAYREGSDRTDRTSSALERAGTIGRNKLVSACFEPVCGELLISPESAIRHTQVNR